MPGYCVNCDSGPGKETEPMEKTTINMETTTRTFNMGTYSTCSGETVVKTVSHDEDGNPRTLVYREQKTKHDLTQLLGIVGAIGLHTTLLSKLGPRPVVTLNLVLAFPLATLVADRALAGFNPDFRRETRCEQITNYASPTALGVGYAASLNMVRSVRSAGTGTLSWKGATAAAVGTVVIKELTQPFIRMLELGAKVHLFGEEEAGPPRVDETYY